MPKKKYIQSLSWDEVRPVLLKLRPDFIELLDDYTFDASYTFYKVRYPFGTHILEKGVFYLPDEQGNPLPLAAFEESIHQDLSYNEASIPFGMLIAKKIEQFVTLNEQIIPFYLIEPSMFVGLSSVLDQLSVIQQGLYTSFSKWEITAGARSTFLLSRISDTQSFKSLQRKYALSGKQPENVYGHWEVFRELAAKEDLQWHTEIIFFPRKLLADLQTKQYAPLLAFFQGESRRPFTFWRNQFSWQVTLSHIERLKNLKYSLHLLDTAKHLLALALGALPAFQPSTTEGTLPLSLIQKIFIEDYKLEYAPVVMEPVHYSGEVPVYYSLNYPTSVEYSAKSSMASTHIADLDEVQIVLNKFLKTLGNNELDFSHSLLEAIARDTRFTFFHSNNENYNNIEHIDSLLEYDSRFLQQMSPESAPTLPFPRNSPFFKGCISISKA